MNNIQKAFKAKRDFSLRMAVGGVVNPSMNEGSAVARLEGKGQLFDPNAPLSTGSRDLDTLGTAQGSSPKFALKSFSELSSGNDFYRAGSANDPKASASLMANPKPMQAQRPVPAQASAFTPPELNGAASLRQALRPGMADGGIVGMAIDTIKNRHAQNIGAREQEPEAPQPPVNHDAARERESDAALARKMKEIEPKEGPAKPSKFDSLRKAIGFADGGIVGNIANRNDQLRQAANYDAPAPVAAAPAPVAAAPALPSQAADYAAQAAAMEAQQLQAAQARQAAQKPKGFMARFGLRQGGMVTDGSKRNVDDVDVTLAKDEAVLPSKTVDALGGPEAVKQIIETTNGKPTVNGGLREGGHYQYGGVEGWKSASGATLPYSLDLQDSRTIPYQDGVVTGQKVAPELTKTNFTQPRQMPAVVPQVIEGTATRVPEPVKVPGTSLVPASGVSVPLDEVRTSQQKATQAKAFKAAQDILAEQKASAGEMGKLDARAAAKQALDARIAAGEFNPKAPVEQGLRAKFNEVVGAKPLTVESVGNSLKGAAKTVADSKISKFAGKWGGRGVKALPYVGGAVDAAGMADVATDPNMGTSEFVEEGARNMGRWGAGTAGALSLAGASLPFAPLAGPLAPAVPLVAGAIGGIAGYTGADKLMDLGSGQTTPSARSYGTVRKTLGMENPNDPAKPKGTVVPIPGAPTAATAAPVTAQPAAPSTTSPVTPQVINRGVVKGADGRNQASFSGNYEAKPDLDRVNDANGNDTRRTTQLKASLRDAQRERFLSEATATNPAYHERGRAGLAAMLAEDQVSGTNRAKMYEGQIKALELGNTMKQQQITNAREDRRDNRSETEAQNKSVNQMLDDASFNPETKQVDPEKQRLLRQYAAGIPRDNVVKNGVKQPMNDREHYDAIMDNFAVDSKLTSAGENLTNSYQRTPWNGERLKWKAFPATLADRTIGGYPMHSQVFKPVDAKGKPLDGFERTIGESDLKKLLSPTQRALFNANLVK